MNQTARHPLVIIQTGLPPQPISHRHGNFSAMICAAAGLGSDQVEIVPVHEGAELAEPRDYCAAVITGSPAMVSDHAEWSERTAHWLRDAVDQDLPILGICYGHQLLAHALGGTVGYNPLGREVGTLPVQLLDGAADQPLLRDTPASFPAHLIHQQSVLEPPPGATTLARSSLDNHQILQYKEHVLSMQYHPEFEPGIMATYLRHYTPKLGEEGFDIDKLMAELRDTPHAQRMLLRFIERYAEGTTTGSGSSATP